jgi:hypothetical protein
VTDPENPTAIDEEPAPELIATHLLLSIDEVVEHLRAADRLGLGVRLTSYLEREGDTHTDAWELELLTASPVHEDEEEVPDEG